MALLNLENFEVYHSKEDPDFKEPVVEIDDFIAPTISSLNISGFKTIRSCSGHESKKSTHRTYVEIEATEEQVICIMKAFFDNEDFEIIFKSCGKENKVTVIIYGPHIIYENYASYDKMEKIQSNCLQFLHMAQVLSHISK